MNITFKELLHHRIVMHCEKLFDDGHFKHAALEAMTQVELAMKEKSGERHKYGVNLVISLFGENKGVKLRVPFGDDLQQYAEVWLKGAFSYYRNYAAHDGSKIDKNASARIMVTASELLELIGASSKSFTDVGGMPGLIRQGIFKNEGDLKKLLRILDDYYLPDHICDGFYEELAKHDFGEDEVTSLIDVGLVEYKSQSYFPSEIELAIRPYPPTELGWFELTPLGRDVIGNE